MVRTIRGDWVIFSAKKMAMVGESLPGATSWCMDVSRARKFATWAAADRFADGMGGQYAIFSSWSRDIPWDYECNTLIRTGPEQMDLDKIFKTERGCPQPDIFPGTTDALDSLCTLKKETE